MYTPNIHKVIFEDLVCVTDMFHSNSNNFPQLFKMNTYTASKKTKNSNIWLGI